MDSEGHFDNIIEILGGIYFRKQIFLRNLGDITVLSVDSFRGHWRQKGVKMHIFVRQENPWSWTESKHLASWVTVDQFEKYQTL